jgi:hypothetical protein
MDVRVRQGHPLNMGRVAWWLTLSPLDGGARFFDLLGLNPVALVGGYSWGGTARPGGSGRLTLDGSTGYGAPASPVIPNTATAYTIAAWVRPTTVSGNVCIASNRSTSVLNPVLWQLSRNGSDAQLIVRADSGTVASATASSVMAAGAWTHLVGVRSGGALSLYAGGVLAGTAAATFGPITAGNPLVGALYGGSSSPASYWSGDLDDVAIWNRALSGPEVAALYDESRRGYPETLRSPSRRLLTAFRVVSNVGALPWAIGEDGPHLGFFEG